MHIRDDDPEQLGHETAQHFYTVVNDLLQDNERVIISLCGGRSVKTFYQALPEHADMLTEQQWEHIHFFWTDERLVPPHNPQSNYKMADRMVLRPLGDERLLLEDNVHRFLGEADEPEQAAQRYTEALNDHGGTVHIPILGVGSDGHVAALFPNHPVLEHDTKQFTIIHDSPKPPQERMTMTPPVITDSTHPFMFFITDEKQEAYQAFKEDRDYHDWPCVLAKQATPVVVTNLE